MGFLAHYGEFLHRPAAAPVLPTITMKEVVKALRCVTGKAAGTDGWTAELLLKLPEAALQELCHLFLLDHGAWPSF